MKESLRRVIGNCIMHVDASRMPEPRPEYFEPRWWLDKPSTRTNLDGRGTALAVSGPNGESWILREYRRGGLPGKIFKRQYAWTGEGRTRPAREFQLLRDMCSVGLPVPAPVGVAVWLQRISSNGALLMEAVADARTLSDLLASGDFDNAVDAVALDTVLSRFHEAGYWHADLNARNIMRDAQGQWWLIDWDRGRSGVAPRRCRANRRRLVRSLFKTARKESWTGDVHQTLARQLLQR